MSHIADLYNDGRTGQHQSIDQARGAYAELIAKEQRVSNASHTRRLLELADVRCPRCNAPVSTSRCHVCNFFPLSLPAPSELNWLDREDRRMRGMPVAEKAKVEKHELFPPVSGALSSSSSVGNKKRTSKKGSAAKGLALASQQTVSSSASSMASSASTIQRRKDRAFMEQRIAVLEAELNEEKAMQSTMLEKMAKLQETLNTLAK